MKKRYIILGTLIAAFTANQVQAQQGFGTSTPAPSSVIDMVANNKGALLPRIALTSTTVAAPVVAPADALTVFNTATAGSGITAVTPGYYYWSAAASAWVRLIDKITAVEPLNVQGSTTQATTNAQDVYQTGKLSVGDFSTATSSKKFEVKGDFKSEVVAGNTAYGTEVNATTNPGGAMHYWQNNTTGDYKVSSANPTSASLVAKTGTTTNTITAVDAQAALSSANGTNSLSTLRALNTGNFFMESYNVTGNFGSTVSLQNDGLRLVHTNTNGAADPFPYNLRSELMVQKENGIRFNFRKADGTTNGEYWFPTTTGLAGQVMTQTAAGKMIWSDPSNLNIYNANGTLTDNRIVTMGTRSLRFVAPERDIFFDNNGRLSVEAKGTNEANIYLSSGSGNTYTRLDLQSFPNGQINLTAAGAGVEQMRIGTNATPLSTPLVFSTSAGSNASGTEKMRITGTGNVGIFNSVPTERFDNNGITRLRTLPLNGATNAINTTSTGDLSAAKDQTFTATNTVVADANGVLGIVAGLPAMPVNIYNANGTLTGNRTVSMAGYNLRFQNAGTESILLNTSNTGFASLDATGSSQGSVRSIGGNTTLDMFTDNNAAAQLSATGTGLTALHVGTGNSTAKPLHLMTNGAIRATVTATGEVAIGATTIPTIAVGATTVTPKFHVVGDISTTGKYYTTNSVYADYVFEKYFKGKSSLNPNYEFKSLNYVKNFIKANHHLPGVESIDDLQKGLNGYTFDMTKLTVQSLEKIEELYLHTIEQQAEIDALKKEAEETKKRLDKLEQLLLKSNQ